MNHLLDLSFKATFNTVSGADPSQLPSEAEGVQGYDTHPYF